MNVPPFNLTRQYRALEKELLPELKRFLAEGHYVLGEEVDAFEKNAAGFLNVKHAIGVSNGTDAIELALRALEPGPGSLVLTTPFTFFATAGAVLNAGLRPVFADIDPETFNLDPGKVAEFLEGNQGAARRLGIDPGSVKALLPVHLYGRTADMTSFGEIARRFKIAVVEDAAQAFGALYGGRRAGTIGDLGCFSFFPTKNLGAFGDAGMVVTNDDALAAKVLKLRVHGSSVRYYHDCIGRNARMDAIQALILRVKLAHLDGWIQARKRLAAKYNKAFKDVPAFRIPRPAAVREAGTDHIYHQYTLRVRGAGRDALMNDLKNKGVGTTVYYPLPLHMQKALRFLGYAEGDFPESEKAAKEVLSLPLFPELTPGEQTAVIRAVKHVPGKPSGRRK